MNMEVLATSVLQPEHMRWMANPNPSHLTFPLPANSH